MQSTTRPISFLPPLRQLTTHSAASIQQALAGLRSLYFPKKLVLHKRHAATTQIHNESSPDSGYASAEDEEDEGEVEEAEMSQKLIGHEDIDVLLSDPFEREFAVKWLTGLIARSDIWTAEAPNEELEGCGDSFEERDRIIDNAASLLSSFAGNAEPDPALIRDFSFPRSGGGSPVRVQLTDGALLTTDHTSVGLQSWASSIILAERICWEPSSFFFDSLNRPGARILELGAGTGLLSIVASRLFPSAEIIATDHHPDVLANLRSNVSANITEQDQRPISVRTLDWSNPPAEEPFSEGSFDMVLAADVVYDPDHAQWIKSCVQRYLRRSLDNESYRPVFWLIIPLRSTGRHEGLNATVERVFPVVDSSSEKGELVIRHKEEIARRSGVGRADEGSYVLFQICWR